MEKHCRKEILCLCGMTAVLLGLIAFAVWLFDPFYQYHKPFFGMEAVLDDRDNQMAGSIRNFDYDSILVGSSVAENFDTDWLDAQYGCRTLKVIKGAGAMPDLLYYVDMAQQEQEIANVFWCLDIFAMNGTTEVSLYGDDIPRYLHTATILDDLPYLYNKEILLEKIPTMIMKSRSGINTGGRAYYWADGKEFGAQKAMMSYEKPDSSEENPILKDPGLYEEIVRYNVEALIGQVESHPEIQYRFIIPPYSMLWWDCASVNGEAQERLFVLEEMIPALLAQENAEVYFFQDREDIVCNLDNYMDMVHYRPEINQDMLELMKANEGRITEADWPQKAADMRDFVRRIHEEEIYRYYPR